MWTQVVIYDIIVVCRYIFIGYIDKIIIVKAAWLSGQHVGLAIQWSRVWIPFWSLAGFVLGRPEFKFWPRL